jgi:signal transduction histidine kinase
MSRQPHSLRNLIFVHEAAFLVLVGVTGLITGLATLHWQQTSTEVVRINNLGFLAEQIRTELFRQIQEVTRARLLEEPEGRDIYTQYSRRIGRAFNQLRRNSVSRAEDTAIQEMQVAYRHIQNDMNRIFSDPYSVDSATGIRILDNRFAERLVGDFEQRYDELKELLAREHARVDQTLRLWTRFAPILIPAFFTLAVLLVIATARIVRAGFVRPMATVKEGAAIISRGDLDHRIAEQGVSEVRDIAESINRMAQDLSVSRAAQVAAERQAALGALVPVVAHNIRNPLASIRATAQMLDEHSDAQDLRHGRAAILETIDRLGRWVNALVSYLHPLKPVTRPVRGAQLVEAALAVLKSRLDEKSIRVERVNWQDDVQLDADPDLMEQAIAGLLANAAEAVAPGGELRIGFERGPETFRMLLSDNGPGLPFEPMPGRLEPGPSTKRFGTGLGLPIAFKICESHGWRLSFRSAPGQGTTAILEAPLPAAGAVA